MSVDLEHFIDLPEPPTRGDDTIAGRIDDDYLSGIENYIKAIHTHLQKIQLEENNLRNKFSQDLRALGAKNQEGGDQKGHRKNEERDIYEQFDSKMKKIKKRRKGFRQMLYDGYNERKKLIESMKIQKREEEYLRRKLQKLAAVDKLPNEEFPKPDTFTFIMVPAQIVTLIIFWIATDYASTPAGNNGPPNRVDNLYEYYTNIAMMVLFGFAFLYTFMRKYAYSALGYSFFLTCWAFELTILWNVLWENVYNNGTNYNAWAKGNLTIGVLIQGMYGAATVLISFGAVLGRVGPFKLAIITFLEAFFYTLNRYICLGPIEAMDLGGTVTIHVFGAYFGLAMGWAMYPPFFGHDDPATKDFERDRQPSYLSNAFAILGTLVMFVMWPAFVVAFAPDGSQFRVVINTVLAMTSSAIVAFIGSRTFRGGKFLMMDIQHATLAGGVAIGSSTAVVISPGGSMVVGGVVGAVAILSSVFIQPVIEGKLGVVDIAGVHNLHGLPGILGGITGIISAAIVGTDGGNQYGQPIDFLYRRGDKQAGYQTLALVTSLGIGFFSGLGVGLVLYILQGSLRKVSEITFVRAASERLPAAFRFNLEGARMPYTDETNWRVPTDFERTKLGSGPEESAV